MTARFKKVDTNEDRTMADEITNFLTSPVHLPASSAAQHVGDVWWERRGDWEYPWRITGKRQGYPCGEPRRVEKRATGRSGDVARRASRKSRRGRSGRRCSSRANRRSANYALQRITRPGSRRGLVDVVEVDARGTVLRVLHRDMPYERARDMIRHTV